MVKLIQQSGVLVSSELLSPLYDSLCGIRQIRIPVRPRANELAGVWMKTVPALDESSGIAPILSPDGSLLISRSPSFSVLARPWRMAVSSQPEQKVMTMIAP
jgi:hypothetical protein